MLLFIEKCHKTSCKQRQFCFVVSPSFSYKHSYRYNAICGRMIIDGKRPGTQKNPEEDKEDKTILALIQNSCSKQRLRTTFV